MEEQVAIIYAAGNGYLDTVDPADVPRVNESFRDALREEGTILAAIRDTKQLSDETTGKLDELLKRVAGDIIPKGSDVTAQQAEADEAVDTAQAEAEADVAEKDEV